MNKEQLLEVACFMRRLEEDSTLKIKFNNLNSIYGMVYKGKFDKYLIVINSTISFEKQIETLWHESKHIYSHIMQPGDVATFEKEAIDFSKYAAKNSPEILLLCRSSW